MGWIQENYINTGKVRFVYKHLAAREEESLRSAEASECAAEQDQFWAYHDSVFADQRSKNSALTDEVLTDIAANLGLDIPAFEECLSSNKYLDQLVTESRKAQGLGIQGTPGFVVNGQLLIGAQPYEVFAELIDQQLAGLDWEPPQTEQEAAPVAVEEIEGATYFPYQPPPNDVLDGVWQNCGIYTESVSLDHVLRSMIHGAVWVAYSPEMPADQIEALRELVQDTLAQSDEPMIILSPETFLETPIVATAWRVQLPLDSVSDPRLAQFLEQYQVGPFTLQPGEPCTGGVGEPES